MDFKENLGRYIAVSSRHMAKLVAKKLEPLEIGVGQYPYIFALFITDGQSQQSLADRHLVDKAAAMRSISKLAKAGYVRRVPDKSDTRSFRIFLTKKAHRMRDKLENSVVQVLKEMQLGLTAVERKQLGALMKKVLKNLTEEKRPAQRLGRAGLLIT
jgi:DNA-binding MarR family transcriptional regulator